MFYKKNIFFLSLIVFSLPVFALLPTSPVPTHRVLIKQLTALYHDHRLTFWYEQPFSEKLEFEDRSCALCPITQKKIQWMMIIPPKILAKNRLCSQEAICMDSRGHRFSGPRCCLKQDSLYQLMLLDLYNYVPEIPALIPPWKQISMDLANQAPEQTRGLVARTYLYFSDTYHLPLTPEERMLYVTWNQHYPMSPWEKERAQRIKAIQHK